MRHIALSELLYLVLSQIARDYQPTRGDYQCRLNPDQLRWHKQIYEASKQCPNLVPLNQAIFEITHQATGKIVFSGDVDMAFAVLGKAKLLRFHQCEQNQSDYFVFSWRDWHSDWLEKRKAEIFAVDPNAAWQFEGLVYLLAKKLTVQTIVR